MVAPECLADILIGELAATFPRHRLLGAWLYGSRARGEARADSDIDLAVLCDELLDPVALLDASGRLSARLGETVDLVDLRRAGGLLRVEATHHGRPLTPLSTEADLFATHALAATRAFEEKLRGR
jgi:uncharacterized protein